MESSKSTIHGEKYATCKQQTPKSAGTSFSYFSTKPHVVGTQKNRLNEMVILCTQKHMFMVVSGLPGAFYSIIFWGVITTLGSEICLFVLILHVPSTIFQLYRDGSSWVEPVLS